jgi:hypothetical protein
LNLPTTSVRDMTIHGDDLVIATHGRSFWILDDITLLRQISPPPAQAARLYKPATAIRVDNDVFLGTPLPPEEPTAKNPPDGAILDYYLPSAAKEVTVEISDSSGKAVRRYVSGARKEQPRQPLPIAERWLAKPVVLENTAGAHRFVWDLRWGSSGANPEVDEGGFGAPRGPRVVPGIYQVKLTVDGNAFTQPLKIEMDPRSEATPAELNDQQRVALEMFAQVQTARKALAEIGAVKKRLSEIEKQSLKQHPELLTQVTELEAEIKKIEKPEKPQAPGTIAGLDSASMGLASALRVVESGNRAIPSQAMDLYREAGKVANQGVQQWAQLKSSQLMRLNEGLRKAGIASIETSQ